MTTQDNRNNSPELTVVVTLFQGVIEDVRLFPPESKALEEYRANWLGSFGYSDWDTYRQELEHAMPDGEFREFGVPIPGEHRFVIVNHGHPWGWTLLEENDQGIYDTLEGAIADAVNAALKYDNDQLRVHSLGPVVFNPEGWTLCQECWTAYPEGAEHTCEEVKDAVQ